MPAICATAILAVLIRRGGSHRVFEVDGLSGGARHYSDFNDFSDFNGIAGGEVSSVRFFIDFWMEFCDDNEECIDPPNVPSRPIEMADVKDRDELYLPGIISQGKIVCNIL